MNYETEKARKAAAGSDNESLTASPIKPAKVDKRIKKKPDPPSDEDTDFHVDTEDDESDGHESGSGEAETEAADLIDLIDRGTRPGGNMVSKSLYKQNSAGASRISSKSTPKSTPKTTPKKTKDSSHFPTTTLSSPPEISKGKTGARRISKLKTPDKKSGMIIVNKALPQHASAIVDLTQDEQGQTQTNGNTPVKPFKRAQLPVRSPHEAAYGQYTMPTCAACHKMHPRGACELKVAGVEHCGLCGLAHYGHSRTCPHIKSETQVRKMLEALKSSPEKKELVDLAIKYLRGVKGTLVQSKKREKEKALKMAGGGGGSIPAPNVGHADLARAHLPPLAVPVPNQGHPLGPQPGFQPMKGAPAPPGPNRGGQPGRWIAPHPTAPPMDDHQVENALRGFLGQSG